MEQPQYPGFQTTDGGLARLHQLIGKLLHESLERAAELQQARAETERLQHELTPAQASTQIEGEPAPPAASEGGSAGGY